MDTKLIQSTIPGIGSGEAINAAYIEQMIMQILDRIYFNKLFDNEIYI